MSKSTAIDRVLILGATGYVGGRLAGELVEAGFRVRCLARTPSKLDDRPWRSAVEVVEGDLTDPGSLGPAFDGVDAVFYLVHSLGTGDDFEEIERACAENAAAAAAEAEVEQLIYLSGLGDDDDDLSPHLRSRHRVGRVLAARSVPTVELRAAVILGSGSASFEMVRGLAEVLPVMATPRWVQETRCQPIAIGDVLTSLQAVLGRLDLAGIWGIGGPDVMTYADLLQAYATAAGLRRRLIVPLPLVTPRLSSRWVDLVTDIPNRLATELVASLQHDVVVGDRPLRSEIPAKPLGVSAALRASLASVQDLDVPSRWSDRTPGSSAALPKPWDPDWAGGTILEDKRSRTVAAEPDTVMAEVKRLGGDSGWLGYRPLWGLRGFIDIVVGGDGRRHRRHPTELRVGDIVDTFRAVEVSPTRLRLRAEMKMPGFGWLEWHAVDGDGTSSVLVQHVRFVPQGVWGRLYWWSLVPFHHMIFDRLLKRLAERSESTERSSLSSVRPPTVSPSPIEGSK